MMLERSGKKEMVRVAVFYDGGYLNEVSNYYKFYHSKQSRISIYGIHEFIRQKVSELEDVDATRVHIVEAHYFRGRFSAEAADHAGKLKAERLFDDVLIRAGVVQHYLPVDERSFRPQEKGIDVWLSLEAFDLAVHKQLDVVALLVCDGDYVPLVRKLNGIGTRALLLAWDFQYTMPDGNERETRTSRALINEATYPLMMHEEIDEAIAKDDSSIDILFID
ncbi:NYN domain-containing protein [candidate division WOR-3 bacterium]|nr:NYN domain-containing protein [candidate division WOR-3 bacterium]